MRITCVALAALYAVGLCSLNAQAPRAPATANAAISSDAWQPSAELNKQMPKWLKFSGSYRMRAEDQDGIGFRPASSDTHFLGELWLGVKIQPASWLSFFGQVQDSRIYENGIVAKAPPYQNTWDIHQAWGEIGSAEKYHFKVRVGRQELIFGDQRLLGAANWLNVPRVFDAVMGSAFFNGSRIDAFASSVVVSVDGAMDHHKQGNPFYGLYGAFTKVIPNATLDPYVYWHIAPAGFGAAYANGARGHLDEKTFGFRFNGKLPKQFDYGVEMARQTGVLGTSTIGAWAGHWGVGRRFTAGKLKPRVLAEYNFASGTPKPTSGKISTFDQLYPTAHDKFGLADQVGWRNIRDFRTGVELNPIKKLAIAGIFHDLRLADAHDGLYAATGGITARSLAGTAGTHVGEELDVSGMYKWNNAVQIGGGYGHIFAGEFLKNTTPGKAYNFPYVMATYSF